MCHPCYVRFCFLLTYRQPVGRTIWETTFGSTKGGNLLYVVTRTTSVWPIRTLNPLGIACYYIRKLVSLYNSIDLNWSIFFDIGCVKIHVKWYRVCEQNRTTFVLLLCTMMTLRTKNPIIPAFSWRHNVFINFNLALILTLFYTINLYISSNMLLEVFHVDHFVKNPF